MRCDQVTVPDQRRARKEGGVGMRERKKSEERKNRKRKRRELVINISIRNKHFVAVPGSKYHPDSSKFQ